MKVIGIAVLAVLALVAVGIGLQFAGFESFKFFAPREEQVRYDTFKQSQAYNEGMLRELYDLKVQWTSATEGQRTALRGVIIHEFSVYDRSKLPVDLQDFYAQVDQAQ